MCGIVAISSPDEQATPLLWKGLLALQHRGRDSSGMALSDGQSFFCHKNKGSVSSVFPSAPSYKACIGVGHCRYCTSGDVDSEHQVHPLYASVCNKKIFFCHNGEFLLPHFSHDSSLSDSCLFLKALCHRLRDECADNWHYKALLAALRRTLEHYSGSFSFTLMIQDIGILSIRDARGIRPMIVGISARGDCVLASESVALSSLNIDSMEDVAPGCAVFFPAQTKEKYHIESWRKKAFWTPCLFEYIYLAHPNSCLDGVSVAHIRRMIGIYMASMKPYWLADMVLSIPRSSCIFAESFSQKTGLPHKKDLLISMSEKRVFMESRNRKEAIGSKITLSHNKAILRGARVIVIDDSIVRGDTMHYTVSLLRQAGVSRISCVLASPPVVRTNRYGINIKSKTELLTHQRSHRAMQEFIGADGLLFSSLAAIKNILLSHNGHFDDIEASMFDHAPQS